MLELLPERVRTPAVMRAITSPSGMLAAGAGTAAAVLGGVPIAGALVVGALAYVGRVALAVPRGRPGDRINPSKVRDPWRRFVIEAQEAKARFDRTVRQTQPGPLRERLEAIGRRIGEGVQECWRIARQGDLLAGAMGELNLKEVNADLERVNAELDRAEGSRRDSLNRTRDALLAQRNAHNRIKAVWSDARDRLEVLNAQLDEAVARAVELSVHGSDSDLSPLGADVDNLVSELEALRLGLEEADGAAAS